MNVWEIVPNEFYRNFVLTKCDEKIPEISALDKKPLADIMNYWSGLGTYIINEKAKNVLETHFEGIQFSEVLCSGIFTEKLYLLIIEKYYDVLDIDNCEYQTIKNRYGEYRISNIISYAFGTGVLDLDIFRIIINGKKHDTHLFVTDTFKNIIEQSDITGLNLRKVFSSRHG